jgi:hypothetical protein
MVRFTPAPTVRLASDAGPNMTVGIDERIGLRHAGVYIVSSRTGFA